MPPDRPGPHGPDAQGGVAPDDESTPEPNPLDPLDTETEETPVVRHEPGPALRKGESCLVVIYGPELGRRIPLGAQRFEIGRSSRSDLSLDQESVSRRHARITRARDGAYVLVDLGSTNGTYVNDEPIGERTLAHGDQIKVGRSILKYMTGDDVETKYHEEIYRLMTVDGLTQIWNKRYFHETLEREFNRARRYERPLSLVLFDIDHFKRQNDRFGHVAGDALLRHIAAVVKPHLRREDIFARVGGEEFAVLLPEIAIEGARATAEKVRQIVEASEFVFDAAVLSVTVSLGVAGLEQYSESHTSLYRAADAALYAAKELGRNRVEG